MEKKKSIVTIGKLPEYRINTTFAKECLLPHEAVDRRYWYVNCKTEEDWSIWFKAVFRTKDNVRVRLKFISVCDNADGRYTPQLDAMSQRLYNMPFGYVRSIWASRYEGALSDTWHRVNMEEVK